jgi:uncharacterized damage-inducible protein DinB
MKAEGREADEIMSKETAVARAAASRPGASEYAPYYEKYVTLVADGDVIETLRRQVGEINSLARDFDEERAGRSYEPGKWSVKELVGHMVDAERIFAYRALRVGRGDRTPLPGFEQDGYVSGGDFNRRALADIAAEFAAVREATLRLFESFTDEAWSRRGVASENEVSVRALAYITAGHAAHHFKILRERYV